MRTVAACAVTFVLAALFFQPHATAVDIPGRTQAQRILASSALVQGSPDKPERCGGTFVTTRRVLTAAHCAPFVDRIVVYDYAGRTYRVSRWNRDTARDLMLLELDREAQVTAAQLADIGTGESVWLVGSPAQVAFMVTRGLIGKIETFSFKEALVGDIGTAQQEYLILDTRIFYGSSGGGVFNDDGRLVGVSVRAMVFRRTDDSKDYDGGFVLFGYAVSSSVLRTFIQEVGR